MYYKALLKSNKQAKKGRRYAKKEKLEVLADKYPYFGYVNIDIQKKSSFVMFSNNDDIVAKSFYFQVTPKFEETSLLIWSQLAKSGGVIFDIGSFSGVYALAAAKVNQSNKVLAFEPSQNSYYRLVTNIWVNKLDVQIEPLNFALGEGDYDSEIRHPFGVYCLGSGESLLQSQIKNAHYTENCKVYKADSLFSEGSSLSKLMQHSMVDRVHLVKIDVEGFEERVLKGMSEIIERSRPIFIIECLDLKSFGVVCAQLQNYEFFSIDDSSNILYRNQYVHGKARNILFYEMSKRDEVEAVLLGLNVRLL